MHIYVNTYPWLRTESVCVHTIEVASYWSVRFSKTRNKVCSSAVLSYLVICNGRVDHEAGFGVLLKIDIMAALGWPEVRAARALEFLEKKGIAKRDKSYLAGVKYYFPTTRAK